MPFKRNQGKKIELCLFGGKERRTKYSQAVEKTYDTVVANTAIAKRIDCQRVRKEKHEWLLLYRTMFSQNDNNT